MEAQKKLFKVFLKSIHNQLCLFTSKPKKTFMLSKCWDDVAYVGALDVMKALGKEEDEAAASIQYGSGGMLIAEHASFSLAHGSINMFVAGEKVESFQSDIFEDMVKFLWDEKKSKSKAQKEFNTFFKNTTPQPTTTDVNEFVTDMVANWIKFAMLKQGKDLVEASADSKEMAKAFLEVKKAENDEILAKARADKERRKAGLARNRNKELKETENENAEDEDEEAEDENAEDEDEEAEDENAEDEDDEAN